MTSRSDTVLGLDLSLTQTGWAALGEEDAYGVLKPKVVGAGRLFWFFEEIQEMLEKFRPKLVVIEGYAFGRVNKMAVIGELGGVARMACHAWGFPFIVVPPTSLKKFATGSGTAEKGNVMTSCLKHWQVELSNNNIADAYVLARIGQAYVSEEPPVLAYQRDVLNKLRKEAAV